MQTKFDRFITRMTKALACKQLPPYVGLKSYEVMEKPLARLLDEWVMKAMTFEQDCKALHKIDMTSYCCRALQVDQATTAGPQSDLYLLVVMTKGESLVVMLRKVGEDKAVSDQRWELSMNGDVKCTGQASA